MYICNDLFCSSSTSSTNSANFRVLYISGLEFVSPRGWYVHLKACIVIHTYLHTYVLTYVCVRTCTFCYIVYSASSSASKSVQGFKEYFDLHKSFYDNVRKLIYTYMLRMYICSIHTNKLRAYVYAILKRHSLFINIIY